MPDPPLLRPAELARRHGLRARKQLGQHFLFDPGLLAKIAAEATPFGDLPCIEIGPGPGGLTLALLEAGAREVVAVERDRRCLAALDEIAARHPGRLRIVEADARGLALERLIGRRRAIIVANLPYNIGTRLFLEWLEQLERIERMVLMFQKEVAERLVAAPGSASYGRLSVLARRLCHVERCFSVPPGAFAPPPRVHSMVVRVRPRADRPPPARIRQLERVTAATFGQRRKMLRSSLRTLGVDPLALCRDAGVDPDMRAEQLSVAQFEALAEALRSGPPPPDAAC